MDELDKLLAPPGDELDALLAPNSASVPPPATGGFRAAAKQAIGSTIKGAGQLAADVAPGLISQDNALKQYGQEVIEANPTKVQGFRDIVETPGATVTEATGNAAGSIGTMLGMRALGAGITAAAPLTGPAAPIVAGAGQLVSWGGPALVAALPSFGGIRGKQIEKDPTAAGDFKDKAIAALGAATVGIIESKFGPQDWAIKLTSEAGRKQLAGMLADTTVMKAIGSGAVKGGAIEGAEELVQNPVEQLASGDNPLTRESLTETAFGGVMGAVGGGVLGGAMGPALRPRVQEQLDDTPSEDPVVDQATGDLLAKTLPEGVVLNGTKNSMANVTFPTADGQTATINIPIDEVSKLLAANKPDELAAALEWVEQERAAKIFKQKQNLPEEGDLTQADVEAQRLQAEAYNKARIGIVPKNPVAAKPAKAKPYVRLPDDPAKPNTVQYNVRGEVRTFSPAEGMSKAEVEEALAARKGPGSQVAWLQKNTTEVTNVNPTKSGEVPAPAADAAGLGEAVSSAPQRTAETGVPPVSQPAPEPTVPTNEIETKPVAAGAVGEAQKPDTATLMGEASQALADQGKSEGARYQAGDKDLVAEYLTAQGMPTKSKDLDVPFEEWSDIRTKHYDKAVEWKRSTKPPAAPKNSTPSASAKAPASPPQGVTSSEEVYNNGGTGELMLLRKRSDGLVMLQDTKDNVLGTFPDAKQAATTAKEMGYSWRDETGQLPKRPAVEKPVKAKPKAAAKPKPAAAKPPTLPGVKYDGKNQYTITEGKAKGASFTVKDLSPESVQAAHDKTVKGFARAKTAPKASVVARVAARKHKVLAPTVAEVIKEDGTDMYKRVPSVEAYTALAEARRELDPKAKIDDRLFYELASMSEKDYQEVLPLEMVESEMVAFHGTPHTVDKFSMSKVGTGEGAQAYGHGLYFASNKEVAEFYRKTLSRPDAAWSYTAKPVMNPRTGKWEYSAFQGGLRGKSVPFNSMEEAKEYANGKNTAKGKLYQVDLAPAEDEYLLWDRPLSEQSEKVQDILRGTGKYKPSAFDSGSNKSFTGEWVYRTISDELEYNPGKGKEQQASEYLHSLGIRGIKYLDGTSRNRPLKDIKRAFLNELPEDAEFDDVTELIGTGKFSPEQDRVITALAADDWLGFDYPAQAISAALSRDLSNYDVTKELLDAVAELSKDATYNYVIFNEDDISILSSEKRALGQDPSPQEAQFMQAGLEGKTVLEATTFLVDNAPTASNRLIATAVRSTLRRMEAMGIKFNFKIAHVGDQVPASLANARGMSSTWFNKTPMTVDVWLNGADVTGKSGMSYEVALHEFIHAATQAALHLGNRRSAAGTATAKAVADLYAVTNEIIAHFNARIEANKNDMGNLTRLERAIFNKRTNALANPHEILAWTLSNKEMQEYLETIKSGPETLWSKFVSSIRTLLGLPVSSNTALAKVLAASEQIFDAPVLELLAAAKTGTPATVAQTTAMSVENPQTNALPGLGANKDAIYDVVLKATDAGPFDGGCVVFAQGVQKAIGGEVVALVDAKGNAEHAAVKLGDTFYDFDGPATETQLIRRFNRAELAKTVAIRPLVSTDLDEAPRDAKAAQEIADLLVAGGSVESQMISSLNTAVKDARTTAANALASLGNPKDALHDKWLQHAPKVLAVTPLSHLAQTYGKDIHWIKDLAKHTNELEATTTRLIDDFFAIHEEATKAAESETGIDKFNRAMLVATFNQMNPTKELSKQDWVSDKLPPGQQIVAAQKAWVDAGMQKATGMTFTQAYAEAKKEYDALGPKTQKQMVEITKYLGKLRDMDRDASLAFIEKVSKEGSDLRKSLMEQFNNSFSRLKGMYFPLSRYGKFVLQFTGTDGRPVIEQFDSIRERKDAMLTAIANGVDEQTIVLRMQDENPAGAVAIPSELLTKLREAITTQYMTDVDKKDKEAVAAVNNQIEAALAGFNQTVLRWLPDTSALKNSMTRKSVLGANPDMLRSVNGYVQRHAGRIAWSTVGRQIEDDIAGFANENKEMAKAGDVDLTMRGHLLNNSRMWLQAVQKERVSALTSHIGKLMTGYFMTSPSTFLVQMTQLPTLTLPHLAAKYKSYGKATSALTTAMGQAFSKKFAKGAMRGDAKVNEVYDAIHRKVSHKDRTAGKAVGTDWFTQSEKLAMVGRLTGYQKQLLALREAESRNLLDISAVHEAIDVSQGNQQGMLGKAMRLAMLPMQHGELASRKAAILASFNLASTGKKDFFEAMDETADVIDKTIYNFSKRDKGWLMQKDLMRIPFTFQTYRIKTALRLGLLFRDSLRAFKEGGMEKGLADAATKEFIGIFATSGALAGTLGVPFAGTAMGIISLLFGSDDDEPKDKKLEYTNFLTETFGQTVGDILAYGLPTVAGVNLSRRIGMGDIYGASSQPPEQLHGAGLAAWWAGNLIGPSYSIAESWVKGYDEIMNKGNYMKGLETASPKPIKDVFKAIRTATDGVKDGAGKKLLDDNQIGPDEILMIALGFAPDEITQAQNAERSLRGLSTRISERRGHLIKQAAEGLIDGDTKSALADIREFNSKMPRFAIGGRDIKPAVRKILKGELGTTGNRSRQVATQYQVPVYME